jgi:hypothetical protein
MSTSHEDEFGGFQSVSKQNALWEPKSKGSKKNNDYERREPSDKSWIMGYYMGKKENQGPRENSTVHTIRVIKGKSGNFAVGDPSMLSQPLTEDNHDVNFWGTGILDGDINEFVQVGEAIKVTWLGRVPAKKDPEKKYNKWDLAVNKAMTIDPFAGQSKSDEELTSEFEDDDNPFSDKVAEPAGNEAPKETLSSIDDEDDDF